MKLSDVVNRINGNIDRFTTNLEYYIGGEHFESNELEVTQRGLLKENLGKLGFKFHFAFQERDVIFMARNPHLRKAGMVRFAGLCSDASYILRSKDESILSQEYLAILLQSNHFWDYCESHKVGSVNFANNWSSIANYEFNLPSQEKQKEVSDKVWAAYRLKKAYRKLLSATEEMVKSQFIEMFAPYPYVPLSYYVSSLIGGRSLDGGTANSNRVLKTGSVSYNYFVESEYKFLPDDYVPNEAHKVKIGDVIISRMNTPEYVGACAYVSCLSHDVYLPDRLWKVEIKDNVHPIFLWQSLIQDSSRMQIKKLASGTSNSMKNISKNNLLGIFVKEVPICEQMKFVEIYKQADKSGFELRKSIEAIDAVIKSLINS